MGKPHVMYAPHPDHHHDTDVMRTFAPIEHDLGGLRGLVGDILAGSTAHMKPRKSLEKYFASLIGPLVSDKIVDQFDQIDAGGGELVPWLAALRFAPRHLVAQYWPRSARARAYSRQKWSGTSLGEVRKALATMHGPAGLGHEIAAREVFPQLFHLRRT
jgi:hypothetical protein